MSLLRLRLWMFCHVTSLEGATKGEKHNRAPTTKKDYNYFRKLPQFLPSG